MSAIAVALVGLCGLGMLALVLFDDAPVLVSLVGIVGFAVAVAVWLVAR